MTIKRFRANVTRCIEFAVDTKKFTRKVMDKVNKDDEIHHPWRKCGYEIEKHVARIAEHVSFQDQAAIENNQLDCSYSYGDLHEIGISVCYVRDPNCDVCDEV